MTDEKIHQISKALSGLSLSEWCEIERRINRLYEPHVVKKSLTSNEINDQLSEYEI